MARENNIDLSRVKGTGAGGRITKQDVEAYLAQPTAPAARRRRASSAAAGLPARASAGCTRAARGHASAARRGPGQDRASSP